MTRQSSRARKLARRFVVLGVITVVAGGCVDVSSCSMPQVTFSGLDASSQGAPVYAATRAAPSPREQEESMPDVDPDGVPEPTAEEAHDDTYPPASTNHPGYSVIYREHYSAASPQSSSMPQPPSPAVASPPRRAPAPPSQTTDAGMPEGQSSTDESETPPYSAVYPPGVDLVEVPYGPAAAPEDRHATPPATPHPEAIGNPTVSPPTNTFPPGLPLHAGH